ncbi:glycosyltransferase family 9 protein [Prauserella oleivorans]|uniref:Glycosyltransferase family 9 protein n=1 Tax=Prauserella oleivorans TaxID=1478153 RepID=A0ABW5WCU1_9PSEU
MAVTLALRALGLGDLLTAVPALRALRAARPDDRLVLAAPEALRPLVDTIDAVDELLPTEGLGRLDWRGERPALAVNLHGSGPESITDLLATDPAELVTHRHPGHPDVPGPPWREDEHEVDRWCVLLEQAGIPADPADLALPPPAVPSPAPGAVVIHPGAAYPARRWPAERFASVARDLSPHRVVITGSAAEEELAHEVARAAGLDDDAVLAGRTGLDELAAVVAGAELVICGDTGVGHLATALHTPSVLLFGPTPPSRWGPPLGRGSHVVLWAGHTGDPFGDKPDPGLLELTEDQVLLAASELVAEGIHA